MRVIVSSSRRGGKMSRKKLAAITSSVTALVIVGVLVAGLFNGSDRTVSDPDGETTVVSAMLSAIDAFGARNADEAAAIWAEGVAARNGMAQYSVMTSELKSKYLETIEKNGGSFLLPTGSTRVEGWKMVDKSESDNGNVTLKLEFDLSEKKESITSSARLTIQPEGEYMAVSSVVVESPLYEFTGIG